jgi:hypothetical protein
MSVDFPEPLGPITAINSPSYRKIYLVERQGGGVTEAI